MKKHNILVLGGGLVGKPIAFDLANDPDCFVTLVDVNPMDSDLSIPENMQVVKADARQKSEISTLLQKADYVVNALPGSIGFGSLRLAIEAGKDIVDIAFYPENPMDLHDLAVKTGARVICDMGVAPGMSHLLAGYFAQKLDHVELIEILVGGLPKIRTFPWEYKAVFSPADVLEEYTRPARLIENGMLVTKPALTEVELVDFDAVGTLEAFNSDGLRSLIYTLKADFMREKTLRYPGYVAKVKLLADAGFLNPEKVKVQDAEVSPLALSSQLLFEQWRLGKGEADLTVMRVVVKGFKNGVSQKYVSDLYDEFDAVSQVHSMARTTGYAATTALRFLMQDSHIEPGILLPEKFALVSGVFDFMLSGLKDHGVEYSNTEFSMH